VPRKGLSGNARETSKINHLTPPPLCRLYQGIVPLSSASIGETGGEKLQAAPDTCAEGRRLVRRVRDHLALRPVGRQALRRRSQSNASPPTRSWCAQRPPGPQAALRRPRRTYKSPFGSIWVDAQCGSTAREPICSPHMVPIIILHELSRDLPAFMRHEVLGGIGNVFSVHR